MPVACGEPHGYGHYSYYAVESGADGRYNRRGYSQCRQKSKACDLRRGWRVQVIPMQAEIQTLIRAEMHRQGVIPMQVEIQCLGKSAKLASFH